MRIIGGAFRGRRLARVARGVRPTKDRLRESLFNILGTQVEGSCWVDAFAGSGAIGMEALSRGAQFVLFNDRSREALGTVEANLAKCRIDSGFEIHQTDAFLLFRKLPERRIDFVFLDPPYRFALHEKLLKAVAGALAQPFPQHVVLLEVYKEVGNDVAGTHYEVTRRIPAGDSHILVLQHENYPL